MMFDWVVPTIGHIENVMLEIGARIVVIEFMREFVEAAVVSPEDIIKAVAKWLEILPIIRV